MGELELVAVGRSESQGELKVGADGWSWRLELEVGAGGGSCRWELDVELEGKLERKVELELEGEQGKEL